MKIYVVTNGKEFAETYLKAESGDIIKVTAGEEVREVIRR